jgi:hypothetical protein
MSKQEISKKINQLSLADALEIRNELERHIAKLALKTISSDRLDEIDGDPKLANADNLANKADML